jgi:hypothetical protein
MAGKQEHRNYEEVLNWLRDHGFDLIEAPGTQARVFLKKYNSSAAIQKNPDGAVKIFAYPGYLIGGEISKLVNRGHQQFLKTAKTEVPATARLAEAVLVRRQRWLPERLRPGQARDRREAAEGLRHLAPGCACSKPLWVV